MNDSINTAFAVGVENFVLFNTEKYGNLQAIMPHLLNASQEHQIVLFSQYSWQTEKIKWLNSFTDRKIGLLAEISKQYNIKPGSIKVELRIYQSDAVKTHNPTAEEILPIIDKIITFDKRINKMKAEEV